MEDAAISAKPQWFPRLTVIIEQIQTLPSPVLDRSVIEKIFEVRRRRAIEMLHNFGGFQTGKTFLIDRLHLLTKLEAIRDGAEFAREQKRRQRLLENLEEARRLAPARKVRISAAPDVRDRVLTDLPAGIHLQPGELRIEFFGSEDLLRHLFELSQAIANDYDAFQQAIGDKQSTGSWD